MGSVNLSLSGLLDGRLAPSNPLAPASPLPPPDSGFDRAVDDAGARADSSGRPPPQSPAAAGRGKALPAASRPDAGDPQDGPATDAATAESGQAAAHAPAGSGRTATSAPSGRADTDDAGASSPQSSAADSSAAADSSVAPPPMLPPAHAVPVADPALHGSASPPSSGGKAGGAAVEPTAPQDAGGGAVATSGAAVPGAVAGILGVAAGVQIPPAAGPVPAASGVAVPQAKPAGGGTAVAKSGSDPRKASPDGTAPRRSGAPDIASALSQKTAPSDTEDGALPAFRLADGAARNGDSRVTAETPAPVGAPAAGAAQPGGGGGGNGAVPFGIPIAQAATDYAAFGTGGTGAAPGTLPAGGLQHPGAQLADHLAKVVQVGRNQLSVDLTPAELGRINVEAVLSDGRIKLTVEAERRETLDMLRADAGLLQSALGNAGLKLDGASLNFSLLGEGAAQQHRGGAADLMGDGAAAGGGSGSGNAWRGPQEQQAPQSAASGRREERTLFLGRDGSTVDVII